MLITLLVLTIAAFVNADTYKAVAVLTPVSAGSITYGTITFWFDTTTNITTVSANISGIAAGFNPNGDHGIHVHQFGDLRGLFSTAGTGVSGGSSVGGHFDPLNTQTHGCPGSGNSSTWHAGDMGNWTATNGAIVQTKSIDSFTFFKGDIKSIVGRAVVLHNMTDNCVSTTSAGARIAYGVIGIANLTTSIGSTAGSTQAVCVLQGTTSCTGASCAPGQAGIVWFTNNGTNVLVTAQVAGVITERAFHVHETGDLSSGDGASVGNHFNPYSKTHGLPGLNGDRHLGDFGTIHTNDGTNGYYEFVPTYTGISWSVDDIIGRAVVVHAGVDHGLEPTCANVTGYATGAAGSRTFWCVIGVPYTTVNQTAATSLPTPSTAGRSYRNTWANVPCTSTTTGASTGTSGTSSTGTSGTTPTPTSTTGTSAGYFVSQGVVAIVLCMIALIISY